MASLILARLHLPLLALPWILLSLFTVALVIRIFPSFFSLSLIECESCQLEKYTRVPFPECLDQRTKSQFELIHTDIWGPSRIESTLGFRYFVTFIDDYSRCT